jgi:hypothetical protein
MDIETNRGLERKKIEPAERLDRFREWRINNNGGIK